MTKFDQPIPLVQATLIQRGLTPNLDFYSFYPPLGLYWNAAAFRVLGQSIVASRAAAGVLYALVVLLVTWFFGFRFRSDPLVPGAVLLVAVTAGTAITMPSWPGFTLALAALLLYLCSREYLRYQIPLIALSGALAAVAILFRINFGAYAVFVIALDFLRRFLLDGSGGLSSRLKNEATTMAAFVLPLVVCVVGLSLWIYGRRVDVGVAEFVVNAQRLMVLRGFVHLDFGTGLGCALTFPPVWFLVRLLKGSDNLAAGAIFPAIFGAGIMVLALAGGKSPTIPVLMVAVEVALVLFMHVFILRLDAAELGILLFYCCMLHYYLSRADSEHLRLLPVAGVLLTPFLLLTPVRPDKKQFKVATSLGTALLVMAMAIFIVMTTPEFRPALSAFPKGLVILSHVIRDRNMTDSDRMLGDVPPPKVWSSIYSDDEEMAALRYFRERTSASTPLFVGFNDHSRIFWNDIRMYWLSGRPMAARIFQLEARVATEAPVQSQIIADLEKKKDAWIIVDTEIEGDPTFFQNNYQGSRLLDDYISQHFKRVAEFGRYWVFTRASD